MFLKHLWKGTCRCIILISYVMVQYPLYTWNFSFQILTKLTTPLKILIKKKFHCTVSGKKVLIMIKYQNHKILSKSGKGYGLRGDFQYISRISTSIEDTRKLLNKIHIRLGFHLKNNLKDERSSNRYVLERSK